MNMVPNNIPVAVSSFIGREQEIADVKRRLANSRLVTLTGAGGCGKTRLAVEVTADLCKHARSDDLPSHGMWLVEFATLSDSSLVPQTLASVLGVREQPNQPLTVTLTEDLRFKHLLLVLDNCEHLIGACAQLVETLLRACPDLSVLATSREAMNIDGENIFVVPSLKTPPCPYVRNKGPDSQLPVTALQSYEAVRLFVERACAHYPQFGLTAENSQAITQICHRLDGIPLAIELAAARVTALSAEQVAMRLDSVFQLLTKGVRNALPHHQTLHAMIDWSYQLLSDAERLLFRRLSVFAGGWTLEAAGQVTRAGRYHSDNLSSGRSDIPFPLDLLTQLVNKSLVLMEAKGNATRYRMLETIRQFARDRLVEAGELEALQEYHLEYFCNLAIETEPKLRSAEQMRWFEQLEVEYENCRAALAWAQTNGSLELGSQLASALHWFWYVRGYWNEGFERSSALLARQVSNTAEVIARSTDPKMIPSAKAASCSGRDSISGNPESYGRLLNTAASMAYSIGDHSQARAMLEEGLAAALSLGAVGRPLLAFTFNRLGYQAMTSDPPRARKLLEKGLAISGEKDNNWESAFASNLLGVLATRETDHERARTFFYQALTVLRNLGDQWFSTRPLVNLASALYRQGDFDESKSLWTEGKALFSQLGDMWLTAYALGSLGDIARRQNNHSQARAYYIESMTVLTQRGVEQHIALPLGQLGYKIGSQVERAGIYPSLVTNSIRARPVSYVIGIHRSIIGLAKLQAARGHFQVAAQMLGSASILQEVAVLSTPIEECTDTESCLAVLRTQLGEGTFNSAWAEGRAMTIEQSIAHALAAQPDLAAAVTSTPSAASAMTRVQADEELRVFAFGTVDVLRGTKPLSNGDWTYAKAKELLLYFLCNLSVTKGEVGLALWPDVTPVQLRSIFGITIHHLRRALARTDWIILEGKSYAFNRQREYWFDVEAFEANLAQAQTILQSGLQDHQEAVPILHEAVGLYRGDFLQDFVDTDWHLLRREELRRKHLEALLTLGQLHFRSHQYAEAAEVYQRAISQDSYLELAHRELMRCYFRQGERGQAVRHYRMLFNLMHDELGSPPAKETTALVGRIRRGLPI